MNSGKKGSRKSIHGGLLVARAFVALNEIPRGTTRPGGRRRASKREVMAGETLERARRQTL